MTEYNARNSKTGKRWVCKSCRLVRQRVYVNEEKLITKARIKLLKQIEIAQWLLQAVDERDWGWVGWYFGLD